MAAAKQGMAKTTVHRNTLARPVSAGESGILQRHHWHGEWNYTIHPAPDPKTQT
jgi:hypothetical protein